MKIHSYPQATSVLLFVDLCFSWLQFRASTLMYGSSQTPLDQQTFCYQRVFDMVAPPNMNTVGQKVFSQPPIVQVLPLKEMRQGSNFHHKCSSTMRDKMKKNNRIICKFWWKRSWGGRTQIWRHDTLFLFFFQQINVHLKMQSFLWLFYLYLPFLKKWPSALFKLSNHFLNLVCKQKVIGWCLHLFQKHAVKIFPFHVGQCKPHLPLTLFSTCSGIVYHLVGLKTRPELSNHKFS